MSGSVGRAEAAGFQPAASPDPTPAGDRIVAGKDRTSSETEESVLLVLVAVIAVIPRTRARCGAGGEVR